MDDQALPADTRLVIAQKSRSAAARSNKAASCGDAVLRRQDANL
jgi:hypothetical protein